MNATLTFLGAAGTVTGSRFAVEGPTGTVMVDAGLYQGLADLRRRNWEPSAVAAADVAAIAVSHAHLDHCGYLPRLVKEGFRGPILCTEGTADLVEIVLRDSAHLQAEDARLANAGAYSKHRPALPLYDEADVERTLPLLRPVALGDVVPFGPDATVQLRRAGHILGSSSVLVDVGGRTVVFSGDLGRPRHPLLRPPEPPPAARTIAVESTYGDRHHEAHDADPLADAVDRTLRRGGSVLVPAFAVDRTELVLLHLRDLTRQGRIPRVPVYLDSPMALATLEVYRSAVTTGAADVREGPDELASVLEELDLHGVRDAAESMRLNEPDRPCIIVSASGMATGGRVIHHLAHQLPDSRNCVVLTGYQAVGTRGRQLQEGAPHVKIHGRYVPVRAEVVDVPGFSVHADADELVAWLASAPEPPDVVHVVHGEPHAAAALAARVRRELGWCAVVPRHGERVRLG